MEAWRCPRRCSGAAAGRVMRRRRLVGLALAATLELYAEEGKAYIEKLQDTVRDNGLWRLDGARSSDGPVIKLFPVER